MLMSVMSLCFALVREDQKQNIIISGLAEVCFSPVWLPLLPTEPHGPPIHRQQPTAHRGVPSTHLPAPPHRIVKMISCLRFVTNF